MSDDELFDLYLKENETIIRSLRVIYDKGYQDGATDMEKAKQIIIDVLLKQIDQIRADAIDEIIEYYKPCNDCGACLEYDRDYFKKKCEMDIQISYTELVADLEQLKEQK